MSSVSCVELQNDVADVMADRFDAYQQINGNLLVGLTQGEMPQNLYLPRRQPNTPHSCIEVFSLPCLNFPQ